VVHSGWGDLTTKEKAEKLKFQNSKRGLGKSRKKAGHFAAKQSEEI
jgi:hypothetical protein